MKFRMLMVMLGVIFLASCSSIVSVNTGKNTQSSSLMDFLYPDKNSRSEHKPELPTLRLPVTVGIAFVPSSQWARDGLHSKDQVELLNKVKKSFLKYDYIDRIEVIPSTYLRGGEGFTTLAQVARLYDVDVMALVSYDQVTQSIENSAGLLYWTIAGMYVIPGNENSVQTFVDTAVFDVKSTKMLFRAPGINKLSERSTAIGIDETLAEKSREGFDLAVTDMSANLELELSNFKQRVKQEKIANVERREGYSGGAMGSTLLLLGLLLLVNRLMRNRIFTAPRVVINPLLELNLNE
ncbi:rhombotarget lipoprotein [Psychrobium sp. 1_MG-2023]|uniref:rhombotarget lipoprotein n=1 Tax=Psychrobium sp. 1_MG-2023 TaxID=3062624 RepID=UPI000C32D31A|nr:rhombotarget lipoprotein [Psychrobium sp. 1_MG-2023]MDP2562446.1 rhombotarget lipoprotein [Psychrobium sp. 1_MG-2023]PKF56172.1 rhombotarget lipoprotein [Alteromonadales bacterium alter-6D02]